MPFWFDIIGQLFGKIYEWIIKPFTDIHSLKDLIFGKTDTNTVLRTFTETEASVIYTKGVATVSIIAGFILLASIIIWGMRISGSAINPNKRTSWLEFMKDIIIVAIVLANITTLYSLIFGINNAFITLFSTAYNIQLQEAAKEISNDGGDVLGLLVINLCFFGLAIWANVYYYTRKLTLMILMILGPLMVVLYLLPQTRSITYSWLKELFGTVMIQSIHAMVFWLVGLMAVGQDLQLIPSLILYIVFIPVSESIRGLLNFGGNMQSGVSRATSMAGMAALSNVYNSAKSALGGQGNLTNLTDRLRAAGKSLASGDGIKKAIGAAKGTDIGSSSLAEKVFKAGDLTSKFGRATLGSAMGIAGATMGADGSNALAKMGYSTGGAIGGLTGRAGALAFNGAKKGYNSFKTGFNSSKNADKNLANEIVDKYATNELNNWASQNKDQFMEDQRKRFPDATNESLENKWKDRLAEKKQAFANNAKPIVDKMMKQQGQFANGNRLANKVAEDLTKSWASNNKDEFMQNYASSNPKQDGESTSAYNKRLNNAWNDTVSKTGKDIKDKAMSIASVQGKGMDNAYLNKNVFANAMANKMKSIDSANSYGISAKQSANKVQSGSVLSASPKDGLNTGYITQQMAVAKTEADKLEFLSQNPGQLSTWEGKEAGVFTKNLSAITSNMPKRVPASSLSLPKNQFVKQDNGAMQLAQNVVSGFQNVGSSISSSVGSAVNNVSEIASIMGGKAVDLSVAEATQKQFAFKNAVALTAGVIGGVSAYQKGANFAMKHNPYNNAVQQTLPEISDIAQMAQKVGVNGQIASGAVQLVTTPNESYIQVRNHAGQTQIVSRKGSGDSSLSSGEVIYQDLSIANNAMVPQQINGARTSAYTLDSGGSKVLVNKELNINPNSLVGNRGSKATQVVEVEAFNQQVDQGLFHIDEIVKNTENLQMKIEKNRSYLVATDSRTGDEYRVSPYGQGDSRLTPEQSVQAPVEIINKKIVVEKDLYINQQGNPTNVKFNSSFDPNSLVSIKSNPRTQSRKFIEQNRKKIGVI